MSRKQRHQRKPSRSSQGKTERSGKPFQFVDRSGKVHSIGEKGAGGHPAGKRSMGDRTRPHGFRKGEDQVFHARPGEPEDVFEEKSSRRERRPERKVRGEHKLKATVDKNHKGFGFLIFENREYEDTFLPPREASNLFHGDRVEVTVSSRGQIDDIRVIEHRFREMVGRFMGHPSGRTGWIVYERKKAREEVPVPNAPAGVKAGQWVQAKLSFHEQGPFPVTAEITRIFGEVLPPSADLGMVAAEYNLIEEHSKEAEAEARAMKLEVPGKDLEGREDLRDVPFITIDGETARDFDDAVYVERVKAGYVLWVAIADVSHYVTEGTALDREARSRGTSVYFPEKAFHMLPRALSENLCSLRPNEPRLSMVARILMDKNGKRLETEVMEAVIQSRRRATYNEIQLEWEQNQSDRNWEFAPHFELYKALRKARADRGSIDFDFPEAEIKVEPTGEIISILQRYRWDSHRLIEEFMIAANEAVTEWMLDREWPFVYRVHEEPAADALEKFETLAYNVGVPFSLGKVTAGAGSPKIMAEIVRRLEGHPAQSLLNMALLRSMKQAVYSSTYGTHYGLASEGYTHFTSPIRRYPDLIVHRLLRMALRIEKGRKPKLKGKERELLEEELAEICEHCSYRERVASDAERESIKLKQVRAMMSRLGDEFEGTINGLIEPGFFVQVTDPLCEGLVSVDTLNDDFYQFHEEHMVIRGRRKKRTFRIGQKVRVRVVKADIDTRKVDFNLVETGEEPETQTDEAGVREPVIPEGRFREKGRGGKKKFGEKKRGDQGRGRKRR